MSRVNSSESLKDQYLELKDKDTQEENAEMDITLGNTEEIISSNDLIQTQSCNSNNDNMDLTKTCAENENVGEVTSMPTESPTESHRQSDENVAKVGEYAYDRLEVGAIGGSKGNDASEEKDEDINKTKQCEPCMFDEIEENGVAFCVICIEYLCKGCARDHRRSKVTRSHKVLHNNELPNDASIFKMMKAMMCCSDHPDMEVSYKCKEHAKFICTRCLAVNHRKCTEVTEVSKNPASPTNGHGEITLSDHMKSLHDKTISVRIAKEENISSMLLEQANITIERTTYIECIQEHLLKLNVLFDAETESFVSKELVELEQDVKECKEIEKSESMNMELLNVAMHYGSAVEFNVISELIKKKADLLTHELKTQDIKETVHVNFEKNTHFIDLTSMGNVLVFRGEKKEEIQSDKPEKQVNMECSSDAVDESILPNLNNQTLKTENKVSNAVGKHNRFPLISRTRTVYDIHQGGDMYNCSISGMLVLSDGRLVVADFNNKSIKVLNPDFSVAIVQDLTDRPIDMCQTSEKHLAIVCLDTRCVTKYIVYDQSIVEDGVFLTKLYPISIDKCRENFVILFSSEKRNTKIKSHRDVIEVRNVKNGAVISQTGEYKSKSSCKLVLTNFNRIRVVSTNPTAYLISDSNQLVCLNNSYSTKWFYKSSSDSVIDGITDIAMDMNNNIYVCGKGSRNIHQVSSGNFLQNRVLLSVHDNPLSVCVDNRRRLLMVGFEDDNCIYVASFV